MTLSDQLREGADILRNRIDERVPIHRIAEEDQCIANTEAILGAMRRAADELEGNAKGPTCAGPSPPESRQDPTRIEHAHP